MKLFEHKDFEQAILGAEQHFRERKLRPACCELVYDDLDGGLSCQCSIGPNAPRSKGHQER